MAGIGSIGATPSYPVGVVYPPSSSSGRTPSSALGTKSGLGETKSADPGVAGSGQEAKAASLAATRELSDEQKRQVDELKRRDREVRSHEQAHIAAGGRYATSGPQFEFTTGPDGRQYATGGHVNIDVGPASTPEATLVKAETVRRAALAPADPSGQDRAVAAAATQLEQNARRQIQEARQAESKGQNENETPSKRELAQYTEASGGALGGAELINLRA